MAFRKSLKKEKKSPVRIIKQHSTQLNSTNPSSQTSWGPILFRLTLSKKFSVIKSFLITSSKIIFGPPLSHFPFTSIISLFSISGFLSLHCTCPNHLKQSFHVVLNWCDLYACMNNFISYSISSCTAHPSKKPHFNRAYLRHMFPNHLTFYIQR